MQIGNYIYVTKTHGIVPVLFNEGDDGYMPDDTAAYYGYVALPGVVPLSDHIGKRDYLIKVLEQKSCLPNPSFKQMLEFLKNMDKK